MALAASALATLLAMGIAQCALLTVDGQFRSALTLLAGGLSLLCVSILLEDVIEPLVTQLLRATRGPRSLLTR